MSLLDFAFKHWDDISAAAVVIGGYLWKKAHHQKTENLWDLATKLGHEALTALLKDPNLYDDAYVRSKLNGMIWVGLSRLDVKRSPVLEKLVDEVVVHLKGELAEQLWKANLGKFIEVQQQTASTLKEAQATP